MSWSPPDTADIPANYRYPDVDDKHYRPHGVTYYRRAPVKLAQHTGEPCLVCDFPDVVGTRDSCHNPAGCIWQEEYLPF